MRPRPADGGVKWHARVGVFECEGCDELMPQRRQVCVNPERLAIMRELIVLDHTECWEFDDPRMAKLQRRFRKRLKRQQMLKGKPR